MATLVGIVTLLLKSPLQIKLVLPTKVVLVSVRKLTPFACNVAVMRFGLAAKAAAPLVMVMKLVMLTAPPAGIVNGKANAGVWTNEVVFVVGPPPPAAGLMETAQLDQLVPLVVVHELVTLLAPGMRLTAPKLIVPDWLGKLQYLTCPEPLGDAAVAPRTEIELKTISPTAEAMVTVGVLLVARFVLVAE